MTNENSTDSLMQSLMDIAQQKTGLTDWGGDEFKPGLWQLLNACYTEAGLSEDGKSWLSKQCIHHLCNRLNIQRTLEQHPEILEVEIGNPLFLVTFPRSGSTFLHDLICSISTVRKPLFWEMWRPTPPPEMETYDTDPRIELTERQYNIPRNGRIPAGSAAENTEPAADEVQECFVLFRNSFASFDYTFEYVIPSYQQWLSQHDLTECYNFFKKQLQILQWRTTGSPWVLKCADHIIDLPALLKVFPNASIVHLHRNPNKMLPSFCYLQRDVVDIWRETPIDPKALGEISLNRYDLLIDSTMKHETMRDDPDQFIDLYYDQFVADPIATVNKLFSHFNYNLDDKGVSEMKTFLNRTRKPNNPYQLSTFDLTPEKINQRYANYIQHHSL